MPVVAVIAAMARIDENPESAEVTPLTVNGCRQQYYGSEQQRPVQALHLTLTFITKSSPLSVQKAIRRLPRANGNISDRSGVEVKTTRFLSPSE
jgi:hypothetical protein